MDPLRHPDLVGISRRMRERMDETLDAEQHAARTAARRQRSLRDRLLDAEDRGEDAILTGVDGHLYRGRVVAVGLDHIVLDEEGVERFVALVHVVAAEFRR